MPLRIRSPKVILALLTALNLLNYLDRFVVSAVITPVQDDLHLSNFTAGLLPTIFLIGYFATSPVFGVWADRGGGQGRAGLIALGVAVWSLATVASGLAAGTGTLIASRAVVGVGEASYATIAPTLIDDLAPPERKSAWMSIFYAATPIGSALGYLVGGSVLHAHGWRAAFFVAGGPGLLAALLCLLIAAPSHAISDRPGADLVSGARALSAEPLYRRTVLGYCAYTFALGGFAYWAPKYIHLRYGLDAGRAAVLFGLLTVVGGAIGTLLGGVVADRAVKRELRRAVAGGAALADRARDAAIARGNLFACTLAAGIGAPLSAFAIGAGSATGFFVALVPCEVALFLLSGPINVALLRSAPPALRASGMALAIFAIHALGDLWSPPLIGLVADHAPMQLAMAAAPVVFGVAAFVWYGKPLPSAGLT